MLPCLDPEADDGLLAQSLGGFQPVQALDQHEARAVRSHQDGRLLAVREHALRNVLDAFGIERGPPLDGHVNSVNRKILALHHDAAEPSMLCGTYWRRDSGPLFLRQHPPHIASQKPGDAIAMSEPIVVVIPHRLGKDEALRRIKDGIGRAKTEFAWILSLEEEVWTGDRLSFRASALGQRASGFIDVYETGVRLEVTLPWLLARFAHAAQRVIGQKGQLMLEKK